MFRSVVSAVALVGILATAYPVFADPAAAPGPNSAKPGAYAVEQAAPPTTAEVSSSDRTSASGPGFGKGIVPVGFGWG